MTAPLDSGQQNAYDSLVATLRQWGLESLAPDVLGLVQGGHDQNTIPILLQQTDAYKQRFSGNGIRRKQGMPVLSPAEYLATEQSYKQIMQSNGLPQGFYDQPSDFADWIGKDVSPQEISTRVNYAVDAAQRVDEGSKKAFQDYYGVDTSHLAAFFLDQNRAMPHIQQSARAAMIGGTGFDNGVNFSRAQAEGYATSGVSDQQLQQTTAQAAGLAQGVGKLGQIYGQQYDATTAANELFFNDVEAKKKRQALTEQETASFAGGSGAGRGSLSPGRNY